MIPNKIYYLERVDNGRGNLVAECYVHDCTRKCNRRIDPEPSLKVVNHSPDGFNWGYGGSGPAQLALAILMDHYRQFLPANSGIELAVQHHQSFKFAFIATLPDEGGKITSQEIEDWLSQPEQKQRTDECHQD